MNFPKRPEDIHLFVSVSIAILISAVVIVVEFAKREPVVTEREPEQVQNQAPEPKPSKPEFIGGWLYRQDDPERGVTCYLSGARGDLWCHETPKTSVATPEVQP